jgi:hypothetical protein
MVCHMHARAVVLAAPLLGLGAFALLEWVDWGAEPEPGAHPGDRLAIWELSITAGIVVWAALAGIGLRMMEELDSLPRKRSRSETASFLAFVYGAIALLLAIGGVTGLVNPTVLTGQQWKNALLHVVAGAAILPLLIAMKRIQLCAAEETAWSATASDIQRIRGLRRSMHTATAALGAIVALAVISTGALRDAVAAAGLTPLPDTFVLVYGAWFTGVLAAIYLHAFGAVDRRARWIMEQAAPLPDPGLESAEPFSTSVKLRAELTQELELGGDPRKNLEGLVAVLSPLVGALLTRLGGL